MSNDGDTYPKSRFSIRTLRVETELMAEDEGDPRGFDISLDDEAAGLILMNCLIHRDRNISFFVEQWPAIKSAVDLIAECAPTHDEVMGDRQLRHWALSLAASEPKASDGGLEMALGQAAAMIERMRESIRRALYAWDTSTYSKGHDGHLWQAMEELRQEMEELRQEIGNRNLSDELRNDPRRQAGSSTVPGRQLG